MIFDSSARAASADISVFIVAAIRLYREGISRLLFQEPGFTVIGTAAGASESVQKVERLQPDIVLLDIVLPDALTTARRITRGSGSTKVVALAVGDSLSDVVTCAEAGICAFVTQNGTAQDLKKAITSAAAGELICSPKMAATLLQRVATLAAKKTSSSKVKQLTAREMEVLRLIDQGLSNKEIARCLSIRVATVKNHVHNLLEKLHAQRRGEAVALMREELHSR